MRKDKASDSAVDGALKVELRVETVGENRLLVVNFWMLQPVNMCPTLLPPFI